jgi:hypothetical protein
MSYQYLQIGSPARVLLLVRIRLTWLTTDLAVSKAAGICQSTWQLVRPAWCLKRPAKLVEDWNRCAGMHSMCSDSSQLLRLSLLVSGLYIWPAQLQWSALWAM